MKRFLSLASFVAVLSLALCTVTSCKHSGKDKSENQLIEQEFGSDPEVKTGLSADDFEEITPVETVAETVEEEQTVLSYSDIEVKPKFQDGDEKSFQKWVADNVQYPEEASKERSQGTVVAQFTVDKEGKIINVKILRGVSPALDAEAVRVLESAPSWKPASHDGEPVEVSYVLPVKFEVRGI